MADGKRRNARRAALGLGAAATVWLLGVWPPPLWWRDHWPTQTAMMEWAERRYGGRAVGGDARTAVPPYHPTALDEISLYLERTVILAEDSRFRTHWGVDLAELADALGLGPARGLWQAARSVWRNWDHVRGASTITQQLAKNLYLSPSRNPLRKLKEAVTAVRLELALSKGRVLELYFNVVEFGPGIWGAEAASREYFGVPAARLDLFQAASLAATLPHPRSSNPVHRPGRMASRRALILARYFGEDVTIPQLEDLDLEIELDSLPPVPVIEPPVVPPFDSLPAPVDSPPPNPPA